MIKKINVGVIKKQIHDRLSSKNLTVSGLEKKAGLKRGAAANILQGLSQNPTIHTLAAIASVLDCKLEDLISASQNFPESKESEKDHELILHLFRDTVNSAVDYMEKKSLKITYNKAIGVIKEAYVYFLTKKRSTVDQEFIEWVIDKNVDSF